ncbi:MAG: hypothetical protein M1828_002763 [Chrysothrix sp. TS-e1954]|nr:MAG: hypothetical protein M1828_002763 [Chrysothrix sp. TS-e1954]
MQYLVRLAQAHETFRRPELEAVADLLGIDLEILRYIDESPFCVVRLQSQHAATALVSRAILASDIYELWAYGSDYDYLHEAVKAARSIYIPRYQRSSFRFAIDSFQGKRSTSKQRELIEAFSYMDFEGPIRMEDADIELCVFEEFDRLASEPKHLWLGRWVAKSDRRAIVDFNLKKRQYISRTSMDAELSLVTANLLQAAPGKIIYDPFVGTGSFTVTAAHFGAMALGSDIDGRSVRGTPAKNLLSNFDQYGLNVLFLDSFIADLTNTPLRSGRLFDGIVCDPPYGVREGPKVLGYREGKLAQEIIIDGVPAHMREGFIPAKRPYSFDDLLHDILDFSYDMLVDKGRVAMWMPTANDEDVEISIPSHPGLILISVCVQKFNKWSRRLLTYQRRVEDAHPVDYRREKRVKASGRSADSLNMFRKKYFSGFK